MTATAGDGAVEYQPARPKDGHGTGRLAATLSLVAKTTCKASMPCMALAGAGAGVNHELRCIFLCGTGQEKGDDAVTASVITTSASFSARPGHHRHAAIDGSTETDMVSV